MVSIAIILFFTFLSLGTMVVAVLKHHREHATNVSGPARARRTGTGVEDHDDDDDCLGR